jgi:hypothetical protein
MILKMSQRSYLFSNLVNKANLVHNLFYYIYQFLHVSGDYVTIIRRNNCVYATLGTCYSVSMTVWYAGSSTQNNKYQVSHKYSCSSWWWTHSCLKRVEIDKFTKNKLCTKFALSTRLYRDARSTKHKISYLLFAFCNHLLQDGTEKV